MVFTTISEAAAAQASGTNLVTGASGDARIQTSEKHRYIRKIGVTGSSAVGNASVKLFYGWRYIGKFLNTSSGAGVIAVEAKDFQAVGPGMGIIQPGEQLIVETATASTTNVLNVTLDIVEMPF